MVIDKRNEDDYEAYKRTKENYIKSRRDYEIYRDLSKLKEMIKTYYDALAKVGKKSV